MPLPLTENTGTVREAVKTADVLEHFDHDIYKVAALLGITRQAVEQWGEVVPERSAYKLQVLTNGRLVANPALYRRKHRA